MNKALRLLFRPLLMMILLGLSFASLATTYTAVSNGNWSAGATWGGTSPGTVISGSDTVVIPNHIGVTLDTNIIVNGTQASFSLIGSMSGQYSFTLSSGTLSGTGSLAVSALKVDTFGLFSLTGYVYVNTLDNSSPLLDISSYFSVATSITFTAGTIQANGGADIILGTNTMFYMHGGALHYNGGLIHSSGGYDIIYSDNDTSVGIEATLSGLKNVTINMPSSSSRVSLYVGLTVPGILSIQSGILVLTGEPLTVDSLLNTASGGAIFSDSLSDITIGASRSIGVNTMTFAPSGNKVRNLTLSMTPSATVVLGSDLIVSGTLMTLNGGLDLNGHMLTVNGEITPSAVGYLISNSSSRIVINSAPSNVDFLIFAPGRDTVGSITVNIPPSGRYISLRSDVVVSNTLFLNRGSLYLNGYSLTLNGTVSTASGTVMSNSSSNIIVSGAGSGGTIAFANGLNTVRSMTINTDSANSLKLGSDAVISGLLTLDGGSLDLNTYNLTLASVSCSGTGTISGSSSSGLFLNGYGTTNNIAFTPGRAILQKLNLNMRNLGTVSLSSDLTISDSLTLIYGKLDINNYILSLSSGGVITGGASYSYVMTSGIGRLSATIANAGTLVKFPIGSASHYAPVAMTNNSSAPGIFSLNAHSGILSGGTSGYDYSTNQSSVNTSWDITSSISAGANVNLEMYWDSTMEVNGFDRSHSFVSHYSGGAWDSRVNTAALAHGRGSYSMPINGFTAFGSFAIFDRNTSTQISEIGNANYVSLCPNPASEMVHFEVPGPGSTFDVSVYDLSGQLIMKQTVMNSYISVSSLPDGIYHVIATDRDKVYRSKLVIAK